MRVFPSSKKKLLIGPLIIASQTMGHNPLALSLEIFALRFLTNYKLQL